MGAGGGMRMESSALTAPSAELVARQTAFFAAEPTWHRNERLDALARYETLGVPERQRTPLKGRRLETIPYLNRVPVETAAAIRGTASSGLTPGVLYLLSLPAALREAGVVVMDFA